MPPLRLLQGRLYSAEGLKQLVADIAQRASLRVPNNYPGLDITLERAERFLADRNRTVQTSVPVSRASTVPTLRHFQPPDPQLLSLCDGLDLRLKKVLVRAIDKARSAFDLPASEELERMPLSEMDEIAEAVAAPFPRSFVLRFMLEKVPSVDASPWKKLNAQRDLGEIETRLAKYEQEVSYAEQGAPIG